MWSWPFWSSWDCEKSRNCIGLLPQTSVCSQPSLPLNVSGLLSGVIYYIIRGNGALCLLRSSFSAMYRIYDGSLHPALPLVSFCHGVLCLCFEGRVTAHGSPKADQTLPTANQTPTMSINSSKKLMFTQFWPKWRPVTPPAAVAGAVAAMHIFSALSADGWSGAGGWGRGGGGGGMQKCEWQVCGVFICRASQVCRLSHRVKGRWEKGGEEIKRGR